MKPLQLSKGEIATLRHALYMLREQLRAQLRLCRDDGGAKALRDAGRFNKLISDSLLLDTKLSDSAAE